MLCAIAKAIVKTSSVLVGIAVVDTVLLNDKIGKAFNGFVEEQKAKYEKTW
jgi:hypothetical protein